MNIIVIQGQGLNLTGFAGFLVLFSQDFHSVLLMFYGHDNHGRPWLEDDYPSHPGPKSFHEQENRNIQYRDL